MQTMTRAICRSKLPVWYSEGFNPHIYLSIAAPLPLGMSSICEVADFTLLERINFTEVTEKINAVLPEGLEVVCAYDAVRKVKDIACAKFRLTLNYEKPVDGADFLRITDFYKRERIEIEKKSKSSVNLVNLKDYIREIRADLKEKLVYLDVLLRAGEGGINPEYIMTALTNQESGLKPEFTDFLKLEIYDEGLNVFR